MKHFAARAVLSQSSSRPLATVRGTCTHLTHRGPPRTGPHTHNAQACDVIAAAGTRAGKESLALNYRGQAGECGIFTGESGETGLLPFMKGKCALCVAAHFCVLCAHSTGPCGRLHRLPNIKSTKDHPKWPTGAQMAAENFQILPRAHASPTQASKGG
eukprot:2837691-Prymnesium_polylepis.1